MHLPRAWRAANIEVYYHPRGPAKNVDVLSYAHEPRTGRNWPIEWTVRYGRGRVYANVKPGVTGPASQYK